LLPATPLSNMAFLIGFRVTFKTWASECTSFQNEIAEAAIAHVIGDKISPLQLARRM
jgi:hypothetical protein